MLGLIGTVCYLPLNQQLLLGPLHFTGLRTMLLVGVFRILARREYRGLEFTGIDKAIVAYTVVLACIASIRVGVMAEVVDRSGVLYDTLLSYFVSRCLLRGYDDMQRLFSRAGYLIVPLALLMATEAGTSHNVFDALGVRTTHDFRHGFERAQGSFQHSITAGVFGATLVPLFTGLSFHSRRRFGLIAGVLASATIMVSSVSSAPLMAFCLGVFCMACWRFRERMRAIRWGLAAALVGLHIVMKAPVWFLISRFGALAGGDAFYRSELIDQAIRHFDQWWFLGFHDTGEWTVNHLADGTADITNQYIRDGVDGGVLALILSFVVLVRCFSRLGTARKTLQSCATEDAPAQEWFVWCLGCALFAHAMTILTVEYYDQMRFAWYMLLAMIASMTSEVLDARPASPEISDTARESSAAALDNNQATVQDA